MQFLHQRLDSFRDDSSLRLLLKQAQQKVPRDNRIRRRMVSGEDKARSRRSAVGGCLLQTCPHIQLFLTLAFEGEGDTLTSEGGESHVFSISTHARRNAIILFQVGEGF